MASRVDIPPGSLLRIRMAATDNSPEKLTFVDPSPVSRRLLWHLFSIGSRRVTAADRHEQFEKPGAHLFWVQSGEGELEYKSSKFELSRGRKVWNLSRSNRVVRPRVHSLKSPMTRRGPLSSG